MKFIVIDTVFSNAILNKHVLFHYAMYEDCLSTFMQFMGTVNTADVIIV